MGCSIDSGAVTKEEEDFIEKERACFLHAMSADELDSIVCRYTATADISPSQLSALIDDVAKKHPNQKPALSSLFADLQRPLLLVFLILLGKGTGGEKAKLLFDVGTDSYATEVMDQSQVGSLVDHIITAAITVAPRLTTHVGPTEYERTLNRYKDEATARLSTKILGDQRQLTELQFLHNYGENSRLSSLAGIRQFGLRCSEKAK
jgi:hypothetical protein